MINWGIIGSGWVGAQFAEGLRHLTDARLLAVCARQSAPAFAERFGVPRPYGSAAELLADRDVDVVYVATPNSLHAEHSLAALRAGKAVVCEKPFAVDAAQAAQVIDEARATGLFCMEGMWMRFLPAMRQACRLIDDGVLGDVRMVSANFGHRAPYEMGNRFFDPKLGGGAFLDVGVYALSLAVMLLGAPEHVAAAAAVGPSGVDEQSAAVLTYPDGRLAVLTSSITAELPTDAVISGTCGELRLAPLYRPEVLTVRSFATASAPESRGGGWRTVAKAVPGLRAAVRVARRSAHTQRSAAGGTHVPFEGNGFNYEAAEAMRCMNAGLAESPLMPLDETLRVMEILDTVRSRWRAAPV